MDQPTETEIETCIRVLQAMGKSPNHPALELVDRAAVAFYKQRKKQRRGERERVRNARDRTLMSQTGRYRADLEAELPSSEVATKSPGSYQRARNCYVCKERFQLIDAHYHLLCPPCAAEHHEARSRRADLSGRQAIVTGGRIKIGFELVRMLLRDGASVIVITRFPQDALRRFAELPEFSPERLRVVGLDLRYLPSVIEWAETWVKRGESLDILVNNAAQTIWRPPAYYRALASAELSEQHAELTLQAGSANASLREFHGRCLLDGEHEKFPENALTEERQPIDLRDMNCWRQNLQDVSALQLIESQLVGAMAPFLLMRHLRPAMERTRFPERFVVNVSAMEGKFDYPGKTTHHPHTNMAKAALNMLTRTSAADFVRSGIYVNSVDTGWITNENPEPRKQRAKEAGFCPPLDVIDGAARVYAPILDGLEGKPYAGQFLKDFRPVSW